jgi:hypothetical protein
MATSTTLLIDVGIVAIFVSLLVVHATLGDLRRRLVRIEEKVVCECRRETVK